MISAVGVRNVVENRVDLTKSRNLIIAAVIFVCGLGFSATGGITFTVGSASITLTGLAIAALAGVDPERRPARQRLSSSARASRATPAPTWAADQETARKQYIQKRTGSRSRSFFARRQK